MACSYMLADFVQLLQQIIPRSPKTFSYYTMLLAFVPAILGLASTVHGSSIEQRKAPVCNDQVSITVSASAPNLAIPASFNLSQINSTADAQAFASQVYNTPTTISTGTYTIRGRFCEPAVYNASRQNTLQVLVHGIAETRYYWSGADSNGKVYGTEYSWQDYASSEGYPTFAIDRLCNGKSDMPSGIFACQLPLNAEVIHQVILQARAGGISGRAFTNIVYVGHSLGSLIGNVLGRKYPKDVDTYVLTGHTDNLAVGLLGTIIAPGFIPAILADPARFATYLDLSYVSFTIPRGYEGSTYFGDYDRSIVANEFANKGTTTVGEAFTALLGNLPAKELTVPVLVLNGIQDEIFCANSVTDPLVGFRGNCGVGDASKSAATKKLYPSAKFEYFQVDQTGHLQAYHRSAPAQFKAAHEFLARSGF